MARVIRVKSSRTDHNCHAGHIISAPAAYSWTAPGFRGRKKFACASHPFRPSQLTTSAKSEPLRAIEDAQDALEDTSEMSLDDVKQVKEDLQQALEEYRDMRQEGVDAWENGNSQMEEALSEAEEAISEIEGHEVEDYDGEEDETDQLYKEHVSEQASQLASIIEGISL